MEKYKVKLVKKSIPVAVVCDKCGKEVDTLMGNVEEWLRHVNVAGYYSTEFEEDTEYSIDLCEQCMVELLKPYIKIGDNAYSELQS